MRRRTARQALGHSLLGDGSAVPLSAVRREDDSRELAMDQTSVRVKRSATGTMNVGRGKVYAYRAPHPPLRIRIAPTYDVCAACDHQIRRRWNIRTLLA
jgi:hypothetical protein